jgi:tetratricopeptide (TPR) repeat protein
LQLLLDALATGDRWEDALARAHEFTTAYPEIELPAETKRQVRLYRVNRARQAASKREWRVSAAIYSQMQEEYPPDTHNLFELAAVSLLGGDTPGYRDVCASMLEQCESASLRRFLVARACTLAEVSDQELMQSTRIAMPELDQNANSYWSLTQRAALLCREGKHREALPILEKVVESSTNPEHGIVAWVWLSRVKLGLGDHDAAKQWLGKATTYLDQSATKPEGIHLHNWLEAHILRQEVETILAR